MRERLVKRKHNEITSHEWELFVKVRGVMLGKYGKEARQALLDLARAMKKARMLRRRGYVVRKPNQAASGLASVARYRTR